VKQIDPKGNKTKSLRQKPPATFVYNIYGICCHQLKTEQTKEKHLIFVSIYQPVCDFSGGPIAPGQ